MFIEGIALDRFSATTHTETVSVPESRTCHAMFHSFLYDGRKIYSTTTAAHSKNIIGFLKQRKIMSSKLGTLWENTGGCAEHHISATYCFVFNVVTILLCYYWQWCKCTCTWHIGSLWLQCWLKNVSLAVNGNCETAKFKRVWHADDNSLCNFYRRCLFSPLISKILI